MSHTTLVIVLRPSEIIIAADSKRTDPREAGRSVQACKIVRTSSFVFAATGYSQDEATGFDVPGLALQASHAVGHTSHKIQVFEQLAKEQLSKAADWFRDNDPRVYALLFGASGGFNIVFGALDGGTPVLYERSFTVSQGDDGNSRVSIWRRDYPDPQQSSRYTAYGETDAIGPFLRNQPNFWEVHGTVAGARRLVKVEIEARPDVVGPPIDIIRIDRHGIAWIEKKPECPEIQDD